MTKGTRETWRDWLPPGHPEPPLITRDELLETLARRGQAVGERTLQHWERVGALPSPIRRHHGRVSRALYPAWYTEVVAAMPRRGAGAGPLAQLRPLLRARFEQTAQQASHVEPARQGHPMAVTIRWALQGLPEPREIDLEASVAKLGELIEEALGDTEADVTLLLSPALIASGSDTPPPFDLRGQIHRIWQSGTWIVPTTAQQPERPASPGEE